MALNVVAKRRLTKLIDFMSKLPRSAGTHFDMTNWAEHPGGFKEHGFAPEQILPREATTLCGTTACALGWACSVPSFYRAGLRLKTSAAGFHHAYPTFGKYHTEDAAVRFFQISHSQVADLFHAMHIRTPKQWVRHAKSKVREWSKA